MLSWPSWPFRPRSQSPPLVAVAPHPTRLLRALSRQSRQSRRRDAHSHPVAVSGGAVKMALAMRSDAGMSAGKLASQAAHGALGLYRSVCEGRRSGMCRDWDAGGATKVVLKLHGAAGVNTVVKAAQAARVSYSVVRDAGRTQVRAGTVTGVAVFGRADAVDKVTGGLKLY